MSSFAHDSISSEDEVKEEKNDFQYIFPKEVQGFTVEQIPLEDGVLKEKVTSLINREETVPRINGPTEKSRLFLVINLTTGFYRRHVSPGEINQAFSVFPRETLEIEQYIANTTKSSTETTDSSTVIDSSDFTIDKKFANSIRESSGQVVNEKDSWSAKVGAKGDLWGFSASASGSFSGASSIRNTVDAVEDKLTEESSRASTSRKAEIRVNIKTSEVQEQTIRNSRKRSIFNPNFDCPLDLIIYDSVSHYINLTQVTGIGFIYQGIPGVGKKNEIYKPIFSKNDLKFFLKDISKSDNDRKKLKEVLEKYVQVDLIRDDLTVSSLSLIEMIEQDSMVTNDSSKNNKEAPSSSNDDVKKINNPFRKNEDRSFQSTYLSGPQNSERRIHKVRTRGIVIGYHEC